jgi:hypothetical protein
LFIGDIIHEKAMGVHEVGLFTADDEPLV